MRRWNLPNLEIINVPRHLGGYAHGIMFDIAGYLKSERTIQADETLGGNFVSQRQFVPHQCSFRLVRIDDDPLDQEFLRIVDLGEPAEGGFPKRLFAAHLLALAENTRNHAQKVSMLRQSVEIYPGEVGCGPNDETGAAQNPGNFFSWYTLGDALFNAGENEEGHQCFRTAVAHWPFGGRKNAKVIVDAIKAGHLPPADQDPRSKFWSDIASTPEPRID